MLNATFTAPDLDTFSQLDRLGLTVTGQLIEPHRSVLECRVLEPDNWCHGCGQQGVSRGTVIRRLAHVPLGWRPTTLQVRVRRYRCPDCCTVWRQDTTAAAASRTKLSRGGPGLARVLASWRFKPSSGGFCMRAITKPMASATGGAFAPVER